MPRRYIKRFSRLERAFHLYLILTFLTQAATGFSRMYIATSWGEKLSRVFGGYETARSIHQVVGVSMIGGFLVHIVYLTRKIERQNLRESIFGPDSLVPNLQDARHLWKRILWSFGLGSPPKLDRWAYWEKFDYWAVFWGLPLLAITGLMLMYPLLTSRILPGWTLNVAALVHRAEAILAISYIFIVHFFIGHLRPSSFPMSESMFSGSVILEKAMDEKPAWVERLRKEGKLGHGMVKPPALRYRILYFVFGYMAMVAGLYLLVKAIIHIGDIRLH